MAPFCQFLTFAVVVRAMEIIDSMAFVVVNDRRIVGLTPRAVTVNISSRPSLSDLAASG